MERGAAQTCEMHGTYLSWWPDPNELAACALGAVWVGLHPSARAAFDAYFATEQEMHELTYAALGIAAGEVVVMHPLDGTPRDILDLIEDLFEMDDWPRGRIVAWLRERAALRVVGGLTGGRTPSDRPDEWGRSDPRTTPTDPSIGDRSQP
jgi:hypothetical protein